MVYPVISHYVDVTTRYDALMHAYIVVFLHLIPMSQTRGVLLQLILLGYIRTSDQHSLVVSQVCYPGEDRFLALHLVLMGRENLLIKRKWHLKMDYVYLDINELFIPRVAISHTTTPNAHTSDCTVNTLSLMDSIAIHLIGSLPEVVLTYASPSATTLDRPKSAILRAFPSPTRTLRQAKSRWTISKLDRYSYKIHYNHHIALPSYRTFGIVCEMGVFLLVMKLHFQHGFS